MEYTRFSVVNSGQTWKSGKILFPLDPPSRIVNCRIGAPDINHRKGHLKKITSSTVVVANTTGYERLGRFIVASRSRLDMVRDSVRRGGGSEFLGNARGF